MSSVDSLEEPAKSVAQEAMPDDILVVDARRTRDRNANQTKNLWIYEIYFR